MMNTKESINAENHFKSINELLKNNIDRIDELYFTETPAGLTDFHDLISGLQPGELIIIAGHSAKGASSLVINIVKDIAINTGIGVVVFSMNMSAESMIFRMMSSQGKINVNKVCSGQLEDDDWPHLTEAVFILNETNIFIDDTPALFPNEIQARVKDLTLEHSIGLVVIDSLQLMQTKRQSKNMPHDISIISNELKVMAEEMNIPVIALSDILELKRDKLKEFP